MKIRAIGAEFTMWTDGHDKVNRQFQHCCEGYYELGSAKMVCVA